MLFKQEKTQSLEARGLRSLALKNKKKRKTLQETLKKRITSSCIYTFILSFVQKL